MTSERVLASLSGLVGKAIEIGPMGAGPGRVAKVTATGKIGEAAATRIDGALVRYLLTIPVKLLLVLNLGGQDHRFHADVAVGLKLTARAAEPLRVIIEVEPPHRRDVEVKVDPEGLRATMLQKIAGVDFEIQRYGAKYIAREVNKPHIRKAREGDVAAEMASAWSPAKR